MGSFNWLQLSDLHFSPKTHFDTTTARNQLLAVLEKERLKCNYLFITGDIANRGEYGSSKEYLDQIISCVKVPASNVFWAVGNHDIKRRR